MANYAVQAKTLDTSSNQWFDGAVFQFESSYEWLDTQMMDIYEEGIRTLQSRGYKPGFFEGVDYIQRLHRDFFSITDSPIGNPTVKIVIRRVGR